MLAVISDIHANLAALEAVLADIDRQGVTDILCLGDIIGYNGEPDECLSLVRARGIPCLMGNHDLYAVSGRNCERSRVVAEIIDDHLKRISADNLSWLAQSAESHIRGADLFLHGGPGDPIDQYIYTVTPDLFPMGVKRLFVGHTHVQAIIPFSDGRVFCNPGSVGQPRDGDPRAAYVTVSDEETFAHRVEYDIGRTVAVMAKRGYEPFKCQNLWKGAQIGGRIDRISRD